MKVSISFPVPSRINCIHGALNPIRIFHIILSALLQQFNSRFYIKFSSDFIKPLCYGILFWIFLLQSPKRYHS
ncbi:MAG: hypothetical protein C4527_15550 [Candidatus Omnitrophota bacterium]|nr:MAG: hypothetical protein C4527_15550 [Candidatus Omnitrophota bacterium]